MAVTRVVDRELVIEITEPAHQEYLSSYDQNDDGEITIDDFRLPVPFNTPQFRGPSDGVVRHFMQESVAEVFVTLGLVDPNQRDGFVRYFDRYNAVVGRVAALKRLVPAMVNAPHTDGRRFGAGPELQLSPGDWKSKALPVLAADGDSGSSAGYQLSTDLYRMVIEFVEPEAEGRGTVGRGCDDIDRFTYDGSRLPEVIAGQTDALVDSWNEIRSSFGEYSQIECEGKGCPRQDEFDVFFIPLQKGAQNAWHYVYCR